MTNKGKEQKYIKEHCSNCTKNIDCKIIKNIKGELVCVEEEE